MEERAVTCNSGHRETESLVSVGGKDVFCLFKTQKNDGGTSGRGNLTEQRDGGAECSTQISDPHRMGSSDSSLSY